MSVRNRECLLGLVLRFSVLTMETTTIYDYTGPCLDVSPWHGNNTCVFLPREKVTWQETMAVCSMYGGHLVPIVNKEDNTKIHSVLRKVTGDGEPWIGIILRAATWSWLSGPAIYSTEVYTGSLNNLTWISQTTASLCAPNCFYRQFTFAVQKGNDCFCSNVWEPSEDSHNSSSHQRACEDTELEDQDSMCHSNQEVYRSYRENDAPSFDWKALVHPHRPCGVLRVNEDGHYISAADCNKKIQFICTTEDEQRPVVSKEALSFFEALAKCRSHGGDLFRSNNTSVYQIQEGEYWIGLTRFSLESYTGETLSFHAFRSFNSFYIGSCVLISTLSSRSKWYSADCSQKRRTVCIKGVVDQNAPVDNTISNTTELILSKEANSWYHLTTMCGPNSQLVTIKDREVNDLVMNGLRKLETFDHVWIPGSIAQRTWSTVTGSPLFLSRGCCTEESMTVRINDAHNNLIKCMAYCSRDHFKYAFIQLQSCGCSNVSCESLPADMCSDRCPEDGLKEWCGNRDKGLYSVYEENALDLPRWESDDHSRACGALKKTSTHILLFSAYCSNKHYSLCETGGEEIYINNDTKTWLSAREECRRDGGDLAVIYSNSSVLNHLEEGTYYWLGISQFYLAWHTEELEQKEMVYTNFLLSLDNYVGLCISLSPQSTYWMPTDCGKTYKALCYTESVTPSPPPISSNSSTPLTSTHSTPLPPTYPTPNTSHLTDPTRMSTITFSSGRQTENDSKLWIAVGATVGVLLFLFVGAIFISMYRRNLRYSQNGCDANLLANGSISVRYNGRQETVAVIDSDLSSV